MFLSLLDVLNLWSAFFRSNTARSKRAYCRACIASASSVRIRTMHLCQRSSQCKDLTVVACFRFRRMNRSLWVVRRKRLG